MDTIYKTGWIILEDGRWTGSVIYSDPFFAKEYCCGEDEDIPKENVFSRTEHGVIVNYETKKIQVVNYYEGS